MINTILAIKIVSIILFYIKIQSVHRQITGATKYVFDNLIHNDLRIQTAVDELTTRHDNNNYSMPNFIQPIINVS